MLKSNISTAVAILALSVSTPASAQYMPHLDPNLYILASMNWGGSNTCITGVSLSDKEVNEARLPAPATMQRYFDAAQNGGSKSASFRASKKAQWTYGDQTVLLPQIDAQTDPLAIAGARLEPDALRFFRAGDAQTAWGQWLVVGPDGGIIGLYDVIFKREKGIWKFEKLTVYGAADKVVPAMQYCSKPGDVVEYKAKAANDQITYFDKEIAKAETKLDTAKQMLASNQAKLNEKPENAARREAVRKSQMDVERREKKLTELKDNRKNAQEALEKSNRDVAEIAAMTLPASEAARFKDFETTTAKEEAAEKAEKEAKKKAEKEAKRSQ